MEKCVVACECVCVYETKSRMIKLVRQDCARARTRVCVCVGDYLSVQDCTAAQIYTWSHVQHEVMCWESRRDALPQSFLYKFSW